MSSLASAAKLITTLKFPRSIKIFNINSEMKISAINEEYLSTEEIIFHICSSNEIKVLSTTTMFKPIEVIVIQYGKNNTLQQINEIISISHDKGVKKTEVISSKSLQRYSKCSNPTNEINFGY